ncbi:hypothetical protein RUM44_001406 [Polyplax serrata]|uniref:Uncharacterized protein n=1 Tax=Polyplax serrata TaxID=468196 RepID=A0ABR1AJX5_POLSC
MEVPHIDGELSGDARSDDLQVVRVEWEAHGQPTGPTMTQGARFLKTSIALSEDCKQQATKTSLGTRSERSAATVPDDGLLKYLKNAYFQKYAALRNLTGTRVPLTSVRFDF